MTPETVEGTAEEIGTDVVPASPQPASMTLFHTDDPVEVVNQAARVADALKQILTRQGLTANIGGRHHVLVEGWTTLGAMLGVYAIKEHVEAIPWPEPTPQPLQVFRDKGLTFGYSAAFRVQRADGSVIGGAEAVCKRTEGSWKSRDDYALESMAQTRATSKSLRGPLGFIVTLAGFEATPEAEIPQEPPAPPVPAGPKVAPGDAEALIGLVHKATTMQACSTDWLRDAFVRAGATAVNAAACREMTADAAQELAAELIGVIDVKERLSAAA